MILTGSGHSGKERHSKDGNGMSKVLRAGEYVFKKFYRVWLPCMWRCMKERRQKRRLRWNFVRGGEGDHRGHEMPWQGI